ncbi:MAG: peroxiredoxin family protein [bacterium]
MEGGKIKNLIIGGLMGAISLIMAVEMLFLVRQNRAQRAQIEKLRRPRIEAIEIRSPAPAFDLSNLFGETVSLSDYEGMHLLLIFFSTECPGCLKDIPNWKRLAALESDTLHVLGITQTDPEETESFMNSYALEFEVAIDPVGEVKEMYKCDSVPQRVLIDRKGRVAYVEAGAVPHNETGRLEQRLAGGGS